MTTKTVTGPSVVRTTVLKTMTQDAGMRLAGDTPEAFDEVVRMYMRHAIQRAKNNGRTTVMLHDV